MTRIHLSNGDIVATGDSADEVMEGITSGASYLAMNDVEDRLVYINTAHIVAVRSH